MSIYRCCSSIAAWRRIKHARTAEDHRRPVPLLIYPATASKSRSPHPFKMASRYGELLTPSKASKSAKSRARREPSGVFAMFQPAQVQQFKEAFSLIDQNRDGVITEQDLRDTFNSLGMCSFLPGRSLCLNDGSQGSLHPKP